jgi:hypothetical protein
MAIAVRAGNLALAPALLANLFGMAFGAVLLWVALVCLHCPQKDSSIVLLRKIRDLAHLAAFDFLDLGIAGLDFGALVIVQFLGFARIGLAIFFGFALVLFAVFFLFLLFLLFFLVFPFVPAGFFAGFIILVLVSVGFFAAGQKLVERMLERVFRCAVVLQFAARTFAIEALDMDEVVLCLELERMGRRDADDVGEDAQIVELVAFLGDFVEHGDERLRVCCRVIHEEAVRHVGA